MSFNLSFGASTRSTLPGSDVEVERITMIAFDSQGSLLFNNTDNEPILSGSEYKLYFRFKDTYYDGCTIYSIVNGNNSYSGISEISAIEQLECSVSDGEVISAKSEGVYLSNGQTTSIGVALEYAGIAKIALEINYDDSIAESDRVISSIKIIGNIYTNIYLFNDATNDSDVSPNIAVDVESLSCLIGGGSSVSKMELTLQNGTQYSLSLPSEMTLQSGKQYTFILSINPDSLTASNTTIEEWNDTNDNTVGFSSTSNSTK